VLVLHVSPKGRRGGGGLVSGPQRPAPRRYACVNVLGLDLVRGRARVRVAAQQHAFFGFRRSKITRATTSTVVAAAAMVVVTSLTRGGEGGGRAMKSLSQRRKYRNNSAIQRT